MLCGFVWPLEGMPYPWLRFPYNFDLTRHYFQSQYSLPVVYLRNSFFYIKNWKLHALLIQGTSVVSATDCGDAGTLSPIIPRPNVKSRFENWSFGLTSLPYPTLTQGLRDISLRGWGLSSPAVYQGIAISSTWTLAFLVLSWFLVRNKLWPEGINRTTFSWNKQANTYNWGPINDQHYFVLGFESKLFSFRIFWFKLSVCNSAIFSCSLVSPSHPLLQAGWRIWSDIDCNWINHVVTDKTWETLSHTHTWYLSLASVAVLV